MFPHCPRPSRHRRHVTSRQAASGLTRQTVPRCDGRAVSRRRRLRRRCVWTGDAQDQFRHNRSRLATWLDVHNLLGAVTILWIFVVGSTGVLNTWADLLVKAWQYGQLAEMVGEHGDRPRPAKLAFVEAAFASAQAKLPSMTPSFVAYPGSMFSSKSHYAIFMRGSCSSPCSSMRAMDPSPIRATCRGTLRILLLSQQLHFDDCGRTPFKIV
ncbi:PepSY domain-containing protein [Bradyrhizobium sp.]|uniref:PepSY domain-containing protein n=1 Tax=Bradyrhizobium sp. TaxID=376 RepID=UPI0039E568FF